MPCWERRMITVDLKVAKEDLLFRAMEAAGFRPVREGAGTIRFQHNGGRGGRWSNGRLEVERGYEATVKPRLEEEYSRAATTSAAKRFGWTVQAVPGQPNKVRLTRRTS